MPVGAGSPRPSPHCISHKRGIAETWRNAFQVPIYRPTNPYPDYFVHHHNRGPADQKLPDLVGVFVNKDAGFINDVAEQVGLHFVQLHGHESPEFCQQIKLPVLKALHLHTHADKGMIKAYQETT